MLIEPTNLLARRQAFHEVGHVIGAWTFGVKVIRVSIGDRAFTYRDDYIAPSPDIGIEAIATICLVGPASKRHYVGEFNDGSDIGDIMQAREILARKYNALQIGAALARYRDAADKLVPWARERIPVVANALLQRSVLTGDEIYELL